MTLKNWAHYVRRAVLAVERVRTETDWSHVLGWTAVTASVAAILILLTVLECSLLGYGDPLPTGVLGRHLAENLGGVMLGLGGMWSYRHLVRWAKEPERVARLLVEEQERKSRSPGSGLTGASFSTPQMAQIQAQLAALAQQRAGTP